MTTLTRLIFLGLLLCTPPAFGGAKADYGNIELLRDTWGVPHVFSDTDAGAMYGLGYATAEDRGLQMTYHLRIIQGRLSEVIGEVRMLNRSETSIDHDRKMRTFSFYRGAQRTVANLDPETRALLEAYCQGVNASFAAQRAAGTLHPLFAQLELVPEPWTPADCLAVWWHVAQFFATDGTRDLIARRTRDQPAQDRTARGQATGRDGGRREAGQGAPTLPADVAPLPPDEAPSVVKRGDVSEDWIAALERYARERGLPGVAGGTEGPKFSHAWVVGGKRTTTGSSVLVSDPQTPVRNPSLFYQFHIQGKTFNARGMGVPGNPTFLIGFTEHVAWGVTAMGADQADLFLLDTDPARPDQYRFDGEWQPMTIHREEIRVKGREPMPFIVRETRLGPVTTAFAFARPEEGEVALKRVPVCEEDRDTIQGAIAMIRARNAREFNAALEGWRFPSANIVFGDREGNIGYKALAAIPVRSRLDPDFGRIAMPGHSSEQDWQEILPYNLLPQVMNPAAGFLYSGNHRAIESWYPIPIFGMTGSGGDTVRSWRLRERLEARERFTPEEVLDIHYDSVNPARRDIVRIGLHLRDNVDHEFTEEARDALARLEPWYRAGASSALTSEGAEVAVELNTFFRVMSTDLAFLYGGGESGLSYFLKTASTRLNTNPQTGFSPVERHFIEQALAGAWRSARQKYGPDPTIWNKKAQEAVEQRKLGYMESLDGFPSLAPNLDLAFPPLTVTDGGTIISQASQSYTQWAPMHDPDQALAILPIGQSERPDSPFRASTMELWSQGRLHPAPLSREKVETITVSRQRLDIRPAAAEHAITLHREGNWLILRSARLPSGEIRINYLEAYCRAGSTDADWVKHTLIPHESRLIAADPDGLELRLQDRVADGLVVDHRIVALADGVGFEVVAHNPTDRRSEAHWAQPCVRLGAFTGFDPDYSRGDLNDYLPKCFVFLEGKLNRMPTPVWTTEARYTPGQVWGGPNVPRTDLNPRPLNPQTPSHGLIGCFSGDESMIFATAWEPYQELFQGVARCLHSDFRLGGLEPGERRKIRGRIYLIPNDVADLLERYRRDFPNVVGAAALTGEPTMLEYVQQYQTDPGHCVELEFVARRTPSETRRASLISDAALLAEQGVRMDFTFDSEVHYSLIKQADALLIRRADNRDDLLDLQFGDRQVTYGYVSNVVWQCIGMNRELILNYDRGAQITQSRDVLKVTKQDPVAGALAGRIRVALFFGLPLHKGRPEWDTDRFLVRDGNDRVVASGSLELENNIPVRATYVEHFNEGALEAHVEVQYRYQNGIRSIPDGFSIVREFRSDGEDVSHLDSEDDITILKFALGPTREVGQFSPIPLILSNADSIRVNAISDGVRIPVFRDGKWVAATLKL